MRWFQETHRKAGNEQGTDGWMCAREHERELDTAAEVDWNICDDLPRTAARSLDTLDGKQIEKAETCLIASNFSICREDIRNDLGKQDCRPRGNAVSLRINVLE